jgi:hypothetical protein
MKAKWKKSPPALIALFDAVIADRPGLERRHMFGYPAAFLRGNLITSLFQDQMMVRLSPSDRAKALVRPGHCLRAGRTADARVCRAAGRGHNRPAQTWPVAQACGCLRRNPAGEET